MEQPFQDLTTIDIPHDETLPKPKNKGGKPGWFGWAKGSPQEIEVHLAFECQKVEPSIRDFFLQRLAAKAVNQNPTSTETNVNKKRKSNATISGQQKITEFGESIDNQIDRALVKAFVICGIPWHIIENPFFIELIKLLRSSYQPPSREILSGRLLAQESAVVNQQVIKHLTHQQNLTLCKLLFYIH